MAFMHDIRYVRIGSDDLDASVTFGTEILGLELAGRDKTCAYLRGDSRDHNVCFLRGQAGRHAVGFEMRCAADLSAAGARLQNSGVPVRWGSVAECEQRRVGNMLSFTDPTGNQVELIADPAADQAPYRPSRAAGIEAFSHVGLRTADAPRDERFWTGQLGAKVSDWIGDAALLRIDDVHHKIALFPSSFPGIQHVNFQVGSMDDIMRSYYFLTGRNVRIVFGPGRHPTSGACFLYFQGPDNIIYEYSWGVRTISAADEPSYVPRHFPMEPSSFCMWGSKPDIPEFKAAAR